MCDAQHKDGMFFVMYCKQVIKMKRLLSTIICSISTIISCYGQYLTKDFVAYVHKQDTIHHIRYELGRFEPIGFEIKNTFDDVHVYTSNTDQNSDAQSVYENNIAPGYLKVVNKNSTIHFYPLEDYYDMDLFQFTSLDTDRFLVFKNRYTFYIFDKKDNTVSKKQTPLRQQYEGEDAISGIMAAFTFFDNEKFLLGNAQSFGIFCYDIQHPTEPIELYQYSLPEKRNEGQFYAFLVPSSTENWNIIIAQSDIAAPTNNIHFLYNRLKNIQYAAMDIPLVTDENNNPKHTVEGESIVFYSHDKRHIIDLISGKSKSASRSITKSKNRQPILNTPYF